MMIMTNLTRTALENYEKNYKSNNLNNKENDYCKKSNDDGNNNNENNYKNGYDDSQFAEFEKNVTTNKLENLKYHNDNRIIEDECDDEELNGMRQDDMRYCASKNNFIQSRTTSKESLTQGPIKLNLHFC